MAKKTITMEDIAATFMDVIERSQFKSILRENRTLYCTNNKKKSSLLIADQTLWTFLMEDQDLNEMTRELNPKVIEDKIIINKLHCVDDMENGWLEIKDEEMVTDERVYLNINGYEYHIELNKTIWPLRFRKSEINNFSYKVFPAKPLNMFAIRKKFESPIEDSSFYLMRLFQII